MCLFVNVYLLADGVPPPRISDISFLGRHGKKKKKDVCCHGNGKSLHGEKCVGALKQLPEGKGDEEGGGGISKDRVN